MLVMWVVNCTLLTRPLVSPIYLCLDPFVVCLVTHRMGLQSQHDMLQGSVLLLQMHPESMLRDNIR